MGDRVAVMREGRLQQVDEPEVLYAEPANLFVAAFIGSPSMNLLEGTVTVGNGSATISLGDQSLAVPPAVLAARPALRRYDGRAIVVGIRPEHLADGAPADAGAAASEARLRGVVELREALGSELLVHVRTDARPAVTEDVRSVVGDVDEAAVDLLERQAAGEGAMVVARFDSRSRARVNDTVEMAVDVERLQFFDPATGERIADGAAAADAPSPRAEEQQPADTV